MEKVFKKFSNYAFPFKSKKRTSGEIILSGRNALLVWQYLRWNKKYRSDYLKLERALLKTLDTEVRQQLSEEFAMNWGMSQPVSYEKDFLPPRFKFKYVRVITSSRKSGKFNKRQRIDNLRDRADYTWGNESIDHKLTGLPPEPIFVAINPLASKQTILDDIEELLNRRIKMDVLDTSYNLIGSDTTRLLENIYLHFYGKQEGWKPKKLNEYYFTFDVFTKTRQPFGTKEIQRRSETFERISKLSPWCFFEAVMQKRKNLK